MRYFKPIAVALACTCFSIPVEAESIQNLDRNWEFGQMRKNNRYPAVVPGVVHLDLLNNGLIEDPYFKLNERTVQWIDKEDWVYETHFAPSDAILDEENVEMVFEGLDTYADVYLNDSIILKADNMFRQWSADVTNLLKEKGNNLKIIFHSPHKIDLPKWAAIPYQYQASNDQSENGGMFDRKLSVFARKAGYHYGWDWGPRIVTSGIWRPVYLKGWTKADIRNIHIKQHSVSNKKAEISNVVEIETNADIKNAIITVSDKETNKILSRKEVNLQKGLNKVNLDFSIRNPRLWWCNGLGNPEMYTFHTSVISDGKLLASKDERTGLRSIKVVTDSDVDGTRQFFFMLNGVPVFAKGANYIPQDIFLPSVSDERYTTTVMDAVNANMNMLRIWGGGIYENDIFYELCDENGIMVWQDFMFACSVYPAKGDWLESVRLEARNNIRRLRNHPSIALWCGGNECLDAWYNWGWKYEYENKNRNYADIIEKELYTQYFDILPKAVADNDPERFYWPSSPFSAKGQGSDNINGDCHYWKVWHEKAPIDQYNKVKSHFFSEYGMQSFPEYSSIVKFAPDTVDHNITGEILMSHQRGGPDANQRIEWYLLNEYKEPKDFKQFLYMNQVLQGDAMRTAIESHRRDMPHCMGSLMWQHNDCWPVASWSTRDYYGRWKAAHYMAKNAFKNLLVSAETDNDSLKVYVVSDNLRKESGKLSVKVFTLEGHLVYSKDVKSDIPANTSTLAWESDLKSIIKDNSHNDVVINLSLITPTAESEGNFFLCKQKDLNYADAHVSTDIVPIDGGYEVALSSDKFVRALWLFVENTDSQFDKNYFDLIPGKSKKCVIKTDMPLDEFHRNLNYRNLNQSYI